MRSVGANGGQAAAFTYDLSRSVVLTRQGNPAWVGQDRDGVHPDPARRSLLRRGRVGSAAGLGRREQDRDSAGGRAAAPPREPDHDDGARPQAVSALLVSPERREGGDRHDGRRPRRRRHRRTLRRLQGREPRRAARWWRGSASASTSYVYDTIALTNAQAMAYTADGFEVALHVYYTDNGFCGTWTPASLSATSRASSRPSPVKFPGIPAPTTERTHCVAWVDWASQPKIERSHGIRLDTNYYHYPGPWIGANPGLHDRLRDPDALRRPRRNDDRRLPG